MKIAFVGYEEANLGCITPVMAAVQRQRIAEPLFVPGIDFKRHRGLRTARTPAGVTAAPLRTALTTVERGTARRRGRELLRTAQRWSAAGAGARAADQRLVAAELQAFFALRSMPDIFAAYALVERAAEAILRRERPALVVLSEDSDYLRGRLLARVAAAQGTRVVCLSPWYYSAFINYPLIGGRRADHYLVGTRRHARRLVTAGVAPGAVTVVGHPELDALAPSPAAPAGHFLFALQGLPWEREIAEDLAAILRHEPALRLTIKPHPALRQPAWLARLARPRNLRIAAPSATATGLMRRTHCVIAQTSRMLWEASVQGRNVLIPHYGATPLAIDVPPRDRSAVVARSAAQLRQRMQATAAGGGRGLSRAAIAPHHPQSTARVVAALQALLRSVREAVRH